MLEHFLAPITVAAIAGLGGIAFSYPELYVRKLFAPLGFVACVAGAAILSWDAALLASTSVLERVGVLKSNGAQAIGELMIPMVPFAITFASAVGYWFFSDGCRNTCSKSAVGSLSLSRRSASRTPVQ